MVQRTPDGDFILQASYGFKQIYYPSEGDGMRTGRDARRSETMTVRIASVSDLDAPLAARLRYGYGDDCCNIELRVSNGKYWRSLMAPGPMRKPCDIETFEKAVLGTVPWVDDPISGRPNTNQVRKPRIEDTVTGPVRKWGPREDAKTKLAFDAAMADILAVNGMLFKRCKPPALVIKNSYKDGREKAYITYAIEDVQMIPGTYNGDKPVRSLLQSDDDETYGPTDTDSTYSNYNPSKRGYRSSPERTIGTRRSDWSVAWRRFQLDRFEDARRFAPKAIGRHLAPGEEEEPDRFIDDPKLIDFLDANLLPLPKPMTVNAETMTKIMKSFGEESLSSSRVVTEAWLDARDYLAQTDDSAAQHKAFERLADVFDTYAAGGRSHGDASPYVKRWVASERTLYATTKSEPDTDGLGGLKI